MHSLPATISPIYTSAALNCYSVLFLRPFSFCCHPISSSSMMTEPILLTNGTPADERPSLEAPASFTPLLGLLLFDILTLIRGLVIHGCIKTSIFSETPSLGDFQPRLKRTSPAHETWLFPTRHQLGIIIIIIIIITVVIIMLLLLILLVYITMSSNKA